MAQRINIFGMPIVAISAGPFCFAVVFAIGQSQYFVVAEVVFKGGDDMCFLITAFNAGNKLLAVRRAGGLNNNYAFIKVVAVSIEDLLVYVFTIFALPADRSVSIAGGRIFINLIVVEMAGGIKHLISILAYEIDVVDLIAVIGAAAVCGHMNSKFI